MSDTNHNSQNTAFCDWSVNFMGRTAVATLALCSLLLFSSCTHSTEIYVYDENDVEIKVARITQQSDGIAIYEIKDKYTIKVDTRYKADAGSDAVVEYIQKKAETIK